MNPSSVVEVIRSQGDVLWLVVGKGPTAEACRRLKLGKRWRVITLNHAALVIRPFLAHFADLEAARDVVPRLDKNVWICMPWHPHIHFSPKADTLVDLLESWPELKERSSRLCSYNSIGHVGLSANPTLPVLRLELFSATAVFSALGQAGVKSVLTLGIDGGTGYASWFDTKDCLANGQPNFDVQIPVLRQIAKQHGMRWMPLKFTAPRKTHDKEREEA